MRLTFLVIVAFSLCLCSAQAQIAVIVNKSLNLSSLDKSTLTNIYQLETKSINGTKLVVFDLKDETQTKTKMYALIGQSPGLLRKEWLKAKLTGAGEPPTALMSEEDMIAKVASTPGAIGYVSLDKVNASVKVVLRSN